MCVCVCVCVCAEEKPVNEPLFSTLSRTGCRIFCDYTVAGGTHQISTDRNGPLMSLRNPDSTSDVSLGPFSVCVCVCVCVCWCKTLQEQRALFERQQ